MRLDPKYFNLFIGICAVITLVVIVFGTMNYSQNQILDFKESISEIQLDTLSFNQYTSEEILQLVDLKGEPVIIHFWSTWSSKSKEVNLFLDQYHESHPNLNIIAAVVKDGDEQVQEYINNQSFDFIFTNGTLFFQELLVPGVPSQILIRSDGTLFDIQVGDDTDALRERLDKLMQNG